MNGRPKVPLAECRDCAAPVVFARLDTGKSMPLNPVPNADRGNVACRLIGGQLYGFVISRDRLPGPLDIWRMVPHFSTCEERDRTPAKPPREPDPELF